MNGSTLKGKPSMWSILEGMSPPGHGFPANSGDVNLPSSSENRQRGNDRTEQDSIFSDTSSVMIYSPLIPTNEDLVELAEFIPVATREKPGTEGQPLVPRTSWTTMWPLSLWYSTTSSEAQQSVIPAPQLSSETVVPRQTTNDSPGRPLSGAQSIRAWVPSNTKLSFQAMWWGYRLYEISPLLNHMNNLSVGISRRLC